MNGHLMDTSTLSRWFAKNPRIEAKVKSLPSDDLLYVSPISVGEIEFGHLSIRANDPTKQAEFRRWVSTTFAAALPITPATARHYANLRRIITDNYFKRGKHIELYEDAQGSKLGIDENDLWLVAQAHERGIEFITCDKMNKIRESLHGRIVLGVPVQIDYWAPD